jgi:penicillin-binding protein 1A
VQPFSYLWKTRSALLDAFVRESAAYRGAIESGTAPELALAKLKEDPEFMSRLRAEKTRLETGFVAMDPATGHVKAWVGSRDFEVDQFDHVAQARRQPGSTFKPFVYGAALEQGMSPEQRFTDARVDIPMADGTVWQPTDVTAPSGREMTIREGLAYSKNTITAQVMQQVGPKKVAAFARKLGVNQSKLDTVPALALGTSPVTLLEMVSAYSTIASGGEFRKPVLVSRIVDKDGNVLESFSSDGTRVLSGKTAHDLTAMMRGVIDQGTGHAIRTQFGINAEVAGKTGTTQNNTDGWFILMHPQLVAGSWVGFNDARVTMRSSHWGQGAQTALPLVGDFYRRALHARLIDSQSHFAAPPDSFFASIVDKVYGWFGWGSAQPEQHAPSSRGGPAAQRLAPVPAPHDAPDAPDAADAPQASFNEMERIMNQARDAAPIEETERAQASDAPVDSVRIMEQPRPESAQGAVVQDSVVAP